MKTPLRKRSRKFISGRISLGLMPSIEPRSQGWNGTRFADWSSSGYR